MIGVRRPLGTVVEQLAFRWRARRGTNKSITICGKAGLFSSPCCQVRHKRLSMVQMDIPSQGVEAEDLPSTPTSLMNTNVIDTGRKHLLKRETESDVEVFDSTSETTMRKHVTPQAVLDTVTDNMKEDEVITCVRNLSRTLQDDSCWTVETVTQDPRFHGLAANVLTICRYLDADELVDVLSLLTALRVSSKSRIFFTTIQLLRHHVNRLDVYTIAKLNGLLYSLDSPLTKALRSALTIVFETHLPYQLGAEKPYKLNKLLMYACKNAASNGAVHSIVKQLLSVSRDMSATDALQSLGCLALVKQPDQDWQRLWRKCIALVFEEFDELPKDRICDTLKRIAVGFSDNRYVYHEQLLDAIGRRLVKENWEPKFAISVAKALKTLNHYHGDVFEYITKYIHEETTSSEDIIDMLGIFSWFGVPFPSLECTTERLMETKGWSSRYVSRVAVAASSVFAGNKDPRLFQRALQKEQVDAFINEGAGMSVAYRLQMVARLYQAKQLFAKSVNVSVSEDILERADNAMKVGHRENMLSGLLKQVLGGTSFVLEKVRIVPWKEADDPGLCSLYADFIISIDKVGNFVEVGNMAAAVDEDQVKWEITEVLLNTIAVLAVRPSGLLNNIDKLKGPFAFDVNLLKAAGLRVLPVSLPYLEDMADIERAPYLLRRIHDVIKLDKGYDVYAS